MALKFNPFTGTFDFTGGAAGVTVNDATISISNITTNNVSTSAHGWAPKLSGASNQFLDGTGNWTSPAGAGTVTTSGSPVNGELTMFSGATSITNGNLSGDVTTNNTLVTTIANNAVTDAKFRQSGALAVVGRSANSTGNTADIQATAASDAVLRESGSTVGFGTIATAGIANNAVTDAKLRQGGALTVIGRSANSGGNVADIAAVAASGAVLRESGSTVGFGTVATAGIANSAVTYAKIQNVSTNNRLLGRATAGAGVVEEITLGTNLSYTGTTLNATGGGGAYARPATKVIAPSNAADTTNADVILTGTNDHTAINTAIGALPAAGGKIIFLDGLITLGGAVVINKSNVEMEGQGDGTKITIANTTNTDLIQVGDGVSAYSQILLKDMLIDGNSANNTSGHGIKIFTMLTHATVESCHVKSTASANIYDDGGKYTTLKDNYLESPKVGSQWSNIEGLGDNAVVEGNICISGDYAAISVYRGSTGVGSIINGNVCITSADNGSTGTIEISQTGVSVTNNFIYNPTKRGIAIGAGYISDISSNSIYITNNPSGPSLIKVAGRSTCNNNAISIVTGNTAAVTGIEISGAWTACVGNFIFANTDYAHLFVDAYSATDVVINGNNFSSSTGTTMKGVGISSLAVVSNNVFSDDFGLGIDVAGGSNCSITGNYFVSVTTDIDVSAAADISITGNMFNGPVNAILSTSDSYTRRIAITGNTFSSSFQDTIVMRSMRHCTVSGNVFAEDSKSASNTYAAIILKTVSGTNYSNYNTITGNTFTNHVGNANKYNVRENSANDGPNIVVGNVALNAGTAQISTQHAASDVSHNLTV